MENNEAKLIELILYAEAPYSRAEYIERVFITPQDHIKYFGSGQDTNTETFEEYLENKWDGREISVGELDGKHSEVYGNVDVDTWNEEGIAEYWEQPDNDGSYLMDTLVEEVNNLGESRLEIMENIKKHVNEVVENIGTKVKVECRVPKDKVDELMAFVEQLNK